MKFQLHFKTPDVIDQIEDANSDEQADEITETIDKFLQWREMITIEFDTEQKTAIVVAK